MKYEEIEVGESYEVSDRTEKVIAKSDEHKAVLTIDEDGEICGWDKNEIQLFQPIKKELPESGLLVHKDKDDFIIYRTGHVTGFGFNLNGKYDIVTNETKEEGGCWTFIRFPNHWKPATPEDEAKFIEKLKQEAEKRGLGVDAKIKRHAGGREIAFNTNTYAPKFSLKIAFNKNGRIFHNGIWAEPLTMLDEVTEVIKKHLPNIVVEQIDGVVTLKQL